MGVKGKIRKHHDLFRQVGSKSREHVERHSSTAVNGAFTQISIHYCRDQWSNSSKPR